MAYSQDPYAAEASVTLQESPTPSEAVAAAGEAEKHTADGFPEKPESTKPPANPPTTDSGVPKGTSKEILAWVGDDKARADAALAAEKQSDQPRKRLMFELEDFSVK